MIQAIKALDDIAQNHTIESRPAIHRTKEGAHSPWRAEAMRMITEPTMNHVHIVEYFQQSGKYQTVLVCWRGDWPHLPWLDRGGIQAQYISSKVPFCFSPPDWTKRLIGLE
jgi:hypothetical protein